MRYSIEVEILGKENLDLDEYESVVEYLKYELWSNIEYDGGKVTYIEVREKADEEA